VGILFFGNISSTKYRSLHRNVPLP